ncbi:MAG: hypothetical protein COV76_01735 [Candidatus Omnitrophica bacterium CG11_big_fil_rev_8_21_14_0_20_64_10]|nr:MAG: hypothetical protein COV76_01735 [Candidatus Omnitrophica bacterium CG11_big_fil_rev_8_21_14_0_20_64_10]
MSSARSGWRRVADGFGMAAALGLLGWVAKVAFDQWQDLPALEESIEWFPLALGAACVGAGQLFLIRCWQRLLRFLEIRIGFRDCFGIYAVSAMGRYLPGKVFVLVGRMAFLERLGVRRRLALQSVLCEMGMILLAAGLLSLSAWWIHSDMDAHVPSRAMGVLSAVIAVSVSAITAVRRGLSGMASFALLLIHYLLFWILFGGGFLLMGHGLTAFPWTESIFSLIYRYALVHILSVAMLFIPGGLGVREAGLQWALRGTVLEPVAGLLALLMRAVVTTFELLYAGTGLWIQRRSVGVVSDPARFPSDHAAAFSGLSADGGDR